MACKNRLSKDTCVAVDVKKKKIVSLEVTSEEVHDSKMLKKMVDNASKNNVVKRVLADGTYDSKINFQYLHDNNSIEAAIKVRKNSTGRSMGCYTRKIAVLQQLKDFDK
jgi:hypothetical protein